MMKNSRIQKADSRQFDAAWAALLVSVAGLTVTRPAAADAASCANLHASGQREAKAGRLKLAAEQFMACGSDESCPEAVRTDCMERYTAVEGNIPTVIFAAADENGADITQAKVYSNDQLVADALDGRPVALEPGKHRFRFVLATGQTLDLDVLVREGEKNRVVAARVPPQPGAPPTPAATRPTTPPAPSPRAEEPQGLPAGFWVAGGLGVAALGSFGTFALLGRQKHVDLADCSPDCSPEQENDYDSMKRNYLIADISLGVAAVSAGVATWLFIDSRSDRSSAQEPPVATRPRFIVAPVAHANGAGLMIQGVTF